MGNKALKYRPTPAERFYADLKLDVSGYFKKIDGSRYASGSMVVKLILFLSFFILCYTQYISSKEYSGWLFWCICLGISSMMLGLNIGHDAVHNALFSKRKLNTIFSLSFDLIGISSSLWRFKHNVLHHNYPNVIGMDMDIEASPLLRLSPADPIKTFHRYQHLYAPLVYTLFSLNLLFVSDLILLFRIEKEQIGIKYSSKGIVLRVIVFKILYVLYMMVIPMLVLPFPWWKFLSGFVAMHMILSLLLAFVLMPAHLFEATSYSHSGNDQILDEDWAKHQISTTMDFSSDSLLMNYLFGGFNTNVIHHLFPGICHCHYRKLTSILKRKLNENQIPYHEASYVEALSLHFKILKLLGRNKSIPR